MSEATPPPAEPVPQNQERLTLAVIDTTIQASRLPPAQQVAVLLNASVLAITRMWRATPAGALPPARGKVINAATEEYRRRLQKYLPAAVLMNGYGGDSTTLMKEGD